MFCAFWPRKPRVSERLTVRRVGVQKIRDGKRVAVGWAASRLIRAGISL